MTPTNPRSPTARTRVRKLTSLPLAAFVFLAASSLARAEEAEADFVVYTYDSFVADGGLGPAIVPDFEKLCHCHVRMVAAGDAPQILNRLQLDARRGKPGAQVVVGLDEPLWNRAKDLLETDGAWRPKNYEKTHSLGTAPGFWPYDYGVLAFMADDAALAEAKLKAPASLADLTEPGYRRKLLLEDPRTSGPGLAFLLYTRAVVSDARTYWRGLSKQWLTLAPGWDGAYSLFVKKEAPLVWSYVTSQAYHEAHPDSRGRYHAVLFKEGQPYQIEGASAVRGGLRTDRDRERAHLFFDYLLSPAVQEKIPERNWMYPAVAGTKLPGSFRKLPDVTKRVTLPNQPAEIESALREWDLSVH